MNTTHSGTLKKILALFVVLTLVTSPILISASYAVDDISQSGFVSHGFSSNPSYAFPSYAFPSYAFPSYAFPSYAFPSYAFPSYAFPSYAFFDGTANYDITPWGLERTFPQLDSNYRLNQLASDITTGDHIHVAVLDTGLYMHSELNNIIWTYDATGGNDMTDVSGHGTHVAGIVSSFNIADIYAIKIMDGLNMEGEWTWLQEGLNAAMRGPDGIVGNFDDADIISMSFGSMGEVPPTYIADLINQAANRGILLVASAGNSGDGNISTDDLIQYPAAYPNVIAVGATDVNDALAPFSNTNSYVEITAPGVDIISTFKEGEFASWSGTSMAAPHVAGLIAYLIYQLRSVEDPEISLKSLLRETALDLGSEDRDNGFGYGLLQYDRYYDFDD